MNYPRSSYLRKNKRNSYQKRKEKSEINSSFKLEYINFNYVDTGADAVEPDWTNPDPSYTWRGITGTDALCNKAFHILYNNVNGVAGNHPDLPQTLSRWGDGGAYYTPTSDDPPALSYLLNSANMCGTTREGYYSDIIQKKFAAWGRSLTPGNEHCAMAKLSCYGGTVMDETPTGLIDTWERGAGDDPSKCEDFDKICENDSNGNPVLNSDYRTQMSISPGMLESATPDEINSWTWEGETGGKAMCTLLDSSCAELSSELEGALPPPGRQREKIEVLRYACNDWFTGNCNKTSSGIISYTATTATTTTPTTTTTTTPTTTTTTTPTTTTTTTPTTTTTTTPDPDSDELNTAEGIKSATSEEDLEKARENFKKLMLYGGGGALAIILILLLIIIIKKK